jgi:hypothetical protein
MARFEFELDTTLSPKELTDFLLDFSDRRPEIWPSIAPEFYEVYEVGETTAEVREGSTMPGMKIWAKEHYDWSTPGVVSWKAIESNFCTPGSGMEIRMTEKEGGGSHVHATWERHPTSFVGRILIGMVVLSRGRLISSDLAKSLKRLDEMRK